MDEREQLILKKAAEEDKKSAAEMAKRAKYKIQIWFQSARHTQGPVTYSISFWESGKRLHGGGDEMMFICRRHDRAKPIAPFEAVSPKAPPGSKGCGKLIPGGVAELTGVLLCPHCGTKHRTDEVGDAVLYRTSIEKASEILATWWRKLDCNADIYVKYCPTDPRVILMSKTMSPQVAREKKGLTIYPLANILKDTLVGATVESRFKALLTA